MDNRRLEWIDISKGMGIILVVLGHTLVPQVRESAAGGFLWIFIYNFHMPLFFFLSGWLFEKGLPRYDNKGAFISGKLKYLMLPYLTFSAFAYLFVSIALHIDKLANVLESGGYAAAGIRDAVYQIITYDGHIDKHLWFVFSLFLVFLINIIMPKIMKSKPALAVLLGLYISKSFVHYFGIIDYITSDLFFFSLARVWFSAEKKPSEINTALAAAVFIITNCIYSYFYVTQMPGGILKAVLYFVRSISSVSGIITVCAAADFISGKRMAKCLTELGMYSYDIYLMHAPFLVSGLMGIILSYSPLPVPIACGAVLIIGLALPYVISRFVIRKTPLLSVVVLGKNHKKTADNNIRTSKTEAI